MDHQNEHYSEIVIRSTEDVWDAMFNYEIDDVFGDVLNYFLRESNQKNREEFKTLCQSIDEEHLNDILNYFLNHYDEEKLLMFFESLDIDQQAYFIKRLVHNVCDEGDFAYEKEIIKFRKSLCHWKAGSPDTIEDAISDASQNNFSNLVQFFRKHSDQTLKFIGALQHKIPQRSKEIIGGTVLELFSYLPTHSDELDDMEALAA